MRLLRKALLLVALLVTVIVAAALWVVATESGTRWLLARVDDRLPEELSLGTLHGSLLYGVELESLEWRGDGLLVAAADMKLVFRLLPLAKRQLIIDTLAVERLQLRISEAPETEQAQQSAPPTLPVSISLRSASIRNIDFERGELHRVVDRLAISGDFDDNTLRLGKLEFRSAWLDLDLAGTASLATDYPLDLTANWRWKERAEMEFGGRLQASGDLTAYSVQHVLEAPLSIRTTGSIAFTDATLSVDVLNEWTSLRWQLDQGLLQASQGSLRVTGQSEAFTFDLDTGLRLDDRAESHVRLSGNGQWTPEPRFDGDYAIAGLDPSLLDERLQGAIDSRGTVALALPGGAPQIALGIDSLGGQLNGQTIDGHAHVAYAAQRTTISDAELNLGANTVSGMARIGDTVRIDAKVDFSNLSQIVAGAAGTVRGQVAVDGSLARPEILIDLQGADLAWGEYRVASLAADARIEGDQHGNAQVRIEGADVGESRIDLAYLNVSGRPEDHNLQTIVQAFGSKLEFEGRGRYAAPAWTADLERIDLANESVGTWSAARPGRLEVSPDEIRLQRICLEPADRAGQACASGVRNAEAASVEVEIADLPLAALPITLPSGITLEGLLNASLQGTLTAEDLAAELNVSLADTSFSAAYDGEQVSLRLASATATASLRDGRLDSSAQVELEDDAGSASAQLAITEAGAAGYPVEGRGDIQINDASVFAVFVPSIDNPRGRIEGGLTVTGFASAPEFVGDIRIVDGAFSVRQTGIDVADVNVRIAQSQPGQMRLTGSARSGDGELSLEGNTRVSQDSGVRSEIWLHGTNFEVARLPDWQVSVSPTITAIFDNYVTTIVGELAIPTANVTVRAVPETARTASPDAVVHRPGESEPARRRRIDLHLRTSLGEDVHFTGFGLTTGLEGAVQLRGGTHAPFTGQGRLGLIGGRYEAYGQKLEIERGNLVFSGPLDQPLLDIRAIRRTPDVIAGIQLTGTPARLQSDVFSEPELGDAEALSYLLTGRPLSSSMTAGEGDTLNRAAFALGLSGAGLVTSQIRSQLGLETLTIEGTQDDSRLVAGKRLGNRLLVEYGYGLVDQLGTLLLRYQLNDRLMLESRSGTVSYLDLLYRARKR